MTPTVLCCYRKVWLKVWQLKRLYRKTCLWRGLKMTISPSFQKRMEKPNDIDGQALSITSEFGWEVLQKLQTLDDLRKDKSFFQCCYWQSPPSCPVTECGIKCHISEVLVMPQDDKNLKVSDWKFKGKPLLFRLPLEILFSSVQFFCLAILHAVLQGWNLFLASKDFSKEEDVYRKEILSSEVCKDPFEKSLFTTPFALILYFSLAYLCNFSFSSWQRFSPSTSEGK